MLPFVEPGQRIIVSLRGFGDYAVGDLIVFESPFYDVDGQDRLSAGRITGLRNNRVETAAGSLSADSSRLVIDREDIMGKVIYYGKERAQAGGEQ